MGNQRTKLTQKKTRKKLRIFRLYLFSQKFLGVCDTFPSYLINCNCLSKKMLAFSVTPFKIYQNKNQNHSIDNVQNLGNERRWIDKDPRQNLGRRNNTYTRYPKKWFTQLYRDLYGEAMLVPIRMDTTWRTETSRNICYWVLLQKREFIPWGTHKH